MSIEAARAGEAGRGFAVVASEVQVLARNSNNFNNEIVEHMRTTKETIGEANRIVEDIASRDMSRAITAKGEVDEMLKALGDFNRDIAGSLDEIGDFAKHINDNVALAVRSLQFEDIVRQAVLQTKNNVEGLKTMVETTCEDMGAIGKLDCIGARETALKLREIRDNMVKAKDQFMQERHKPVHQETMSEGSVELF